MEKDLSTLIRVYPKYSKSFSLHPNATGSKKQRLMYLFLHFPERQKNFYKKELFGADYTGTGYEVLRGELLDHVLEGFWLVDKKNVLSEHTKAMKKRIRLLKDVQTLKLLDAQSIIPSAHITLSNTFKRKLRLAEELEAYEEQLFLIKACIWGSKSRVELEKYRKKMNTLIGYISVENSFWAIQKQWAIEFGAKKNTSLERIRYYQKLVLELEQMIERIGANNKLLQSINLFRLKVYDLERDYLSMIECSTKGLQIGKTVAASNVKGRLFTYMCYAYGNLGDENSFNYWLKKAYLDMPENSRNWYVLTEVECGFRLMNLEFDTAYDILERAFNNTGFNDLDSSRSATWRVLEKYAHFARESGIWYTPSKMNKETSLCARPISGSFNELKSDKTGTNVSLIILDFLTNLNSQKFENIIDRYDSIKRYLNRYLGKGATKRPKIFIGMLLKVIQLDFNAFEIEKKTRKQLEKLKTMNPNLNMNMGGNEIIRYEVLWDWILKKLKESSLLPKPKA